MTSLVILIIVIISITVLTFFAGYYYAIGESINEDILEFEDAKLGLRNSNFLRHFETYSNWDYYD